MASFVFPGGLSVEARGRTLIAHEAAGFGEWGASDAGEGTFEQPAAGHRGTIESNMTSVNPGQDGPRYL